jgi:PIN domain nuclease of toxin-antitoxin system
VNAWLVDTHALLWFLRGDPRLSDTARVAIEPRSRRMLVSAASIWEVAIKSRLGKLEVPKGVVDHALAEGFELLDVTAAHAWAVTKLPIGVHGDPFDQLLAVQALAEDIPIISADTRLDGYGVRRLW